MELNAFPLSAPDSESVRKSSKEKRPINARSGAVSAVKVCPLTHTHTHSARMCAYSLICPRIRNGTLGFFFFNVNSNF